MTLLELRDVEVAYGPITAVHGVSLDVEAGQTVTLLGPNGAGKTSIARAISGLTPLRAGTIRFRDREIQGLDAAEIVRAGIAVVPEGRRVFPRLTVMENLLVGGYSRSRAERAETLAGIFRYFPVLQERRGQLAGSLSGGQQQMLALGRALMSHPGLIILDEPSLGLAPKVVAEIAGIVRRLRDEGRSILLIEQNSYLALRLADYAYVLERGGIVQHGPAEDVARSDHVRQVYLGLAASATGV